MLTYSHNHAREILLWQCSFHINEKQNSKSFFNYDANLTSVITMKLKFIFFSLRCWFHCITSLAVTSSKLKTSLKFEVLLLNSGYAPDNGHANSEIGCYIALLWNCVHSLTKKKTICFIQTAKKLTMSRLLLKPGPRTWTRTLKNLD